MRKADWCCDPNDCVDISANVQRFDAMTVNVRISRSGQAAPQPVNLLGSVAQVPLGQEDVALLADKVVP